ncbi:MAG: peptide deformylase [Bacilli bacterium]|nr:peptide deformylase [Bacilli bacterium]
MFKKLKILDEKDKRLRLISKEITFPLSTEDKELIKTAMDNLRYSQIDKYARMYDLRAGWGLSAIQLGIAKRWFVIVEEQEDGSFKEYFFANPRIISNSEEKIYVEQGEGCLSVNRNVIGIIPRYARITVEAYDIDGKKFQIRLREDLSVCVQHEMDHLQGILFFDKIDRKNPFKDADKYRAI